ncbi:formate dehydrogenase N subunit beta transmembrane domain-containing protein [uncultured Corynebacterium sp.]
MVFSLKSGLAIAAQALAFVLHVLAVGPNKEQAESWPLQCISQVLE